jgi:hypothetical protein
MKDFRQMSPYELFAATRPRLLSRQADMGAVSLLGQAVADVLDETCPESDVLQMIDDLESARSDAAAEVINERWQLPLTSLVGLLRQNLHNRTVQAAAINPSSTTLRDKVLAAIGAGIDTPTAIGERVQSPTTVVSRVLRQLAREGRVEPAVQGEDRRRRPYRLVHAAADSDVDEDAGEVVLPYRVVDPSSGIPGREESVAPPQRGLGDVAALVDFAETQTQANARAAAALLPDLIAAGSNARLDPALRVAALSVAGVITRSSAARDAKEDAVDLAETTKSIAKDSNDDLVKARAAYESARAGFFAFPEQPETYLPDLERAEKFAGAGEGAEGKIRLGWCAYTRCLIEASTDPTSATEHVRRALDLFRAVDFSYGEAAALTLLARVSYGSGAWEGAGRLALNALSIANTHGYLRIMAESSLWAGALLAGAEPDYARHLFNSAAEQFEAVGSMSWAAMAHRLHEAAASAPLPELESTLEDLLPSAGEGPGVWHQEPSPSAAPRLSASM